MLFVVYDTQGGGRVVGVFDDGVTAERVVAVNPPYYALHECRVNELNPAALRWLPTEELKQKLAAAAGR